MQHLGVLRNVQVHCAMSKSVAQCQSVLRNVQISSLFHRLTETHSKDVELLKSEKEQEQQDYEMYKP